MQKLLAPILAPLLLLSAQTARADSIDGDWCSADETRRLSVEGPRINTPGGQVAQGDYSRHAFAYTAPEGEPEAGQAVRMHLLGEEVMQRQAGTSVPDLWHRCDLST